MLHFISEMSGVIIIIIIYACVLIYFHNLPEGHGYRDNNNSSTINNSSGEETIKITCPSCDGKGYDEKVYGEYQNYPASSCTMCGGNGQRLTRDIKEKVFYKGSWQPAIRTVRNESCKYGRGHFFAVVPKGQDSLSSNQYSFIRTKHFNKHTVPRDSVVTRRLAE